jgi:hypothetical protein
VSRVIKAGWLQMSALVAATVVAAIGLLYAVTPALAENPVTQGELARRIVSELGIESGLPADPNHDDIRAALGSLGRLHFEAEDVYNAAGDSVTLRNYPLHGDFSGSGWLNAPAVSTTVRFRVFVPRRGTYRLSVVSRGGNQTWRVGGSVVTVSAGSILQRVDAGLVALQAGSQEISVVLPPEGGADSFSLTATDIMPIEPLHGWRFDEALTRGDVAETLASFLGHESRLPVMKGGVRLISVAEYENLPASVATTTADYLGKPVNPRWIRSGSEPATIELPLSVSESGVYDVRVRLMGKKLALELNGKRMEFEGKPFLDWYSLGTFRLGPKTSTLLMELPAHGGADAVELTRRASSSADYLTLMGISGKATDPVSAAELDIIINQTLGKSRGGR